MAHGNNTQMLPIVYGVPQPTLDREYVSKTRLAIQNDVCPIVV